MKKRKLPENDQIGVMLLHPLFNCLDAEQKRRLQSYVSLGTFKVGEVLITEGQIHECFYVILNGKVSITRRDQGRDTQVPLTSVGAGAVVGESSALLSRPAIAGVRAESELLTGMLDVTGLRESQGGADIWSSLLEGVARELATKLEEAGDRTVSHYRWQLKQLSEKRAASRFTLQTLVSLGLYALLSSVVMDLEQSLVMHLSAMTLLTLFCALATWRFMKGSSLAPAEFGISLEGWKERCFEALSFSVPVVVALLLVKEALKSVPSLVLFMPLPAQSAPGQMVILIGLLALLSVAQEFVVRCGIQGSLQVFYSEDRLAFPWKAILVSNLLFAGTYAHLGPFWVLITFLPGLFWGWLFARQNSLLAVALSHFLIAGVSLMLFGFPVH